MRKTFSTIAFAACIAMPLVGTSTESFAADSSQANEPRKGAPNAPDGGKQILVVGGHGGTSVKAGPGGIQSEPQNTKKPLLRFNSKNPQKSAP
jgi:hypothetical protein